MTPLVCLLAKCFYLVYILFIYLFLIRSSLSCGCVWGKCVSVFDDSVSSARRGHPLTAAEVSDPIRESERLLIFWHWEGNGQSYSSNVQWLGGPSEGLVLTECHLQFTSYLLFQLLEGSLDVIHFLKSVANILVLSSISKKTPNNLFSL